MNKNSLLSIAVLLALGIVGAVSCKKKIHSNAPTPNNVRLLSYNKITTYNISVPVSIPNSRVTESFRFYYDANNRVSQIVYTGNDTFEIHKRIDFTYSNDTIFKTITNVLGNYVVERDTFIKNADGFIVTAFTPGYTIHNEPSGIKNTFEYYGKLLARNTKAVTNWNNITMTSQVAYTSVNGDFLKQNPQNKLDVEFFNLTQGYDIDWWQGWVTKDGSLSGIGGSDSSHIEDLYSDKYTFNTYAYTKDLRLYIEDTLHDTSAMQYPAWNWYNESYHFYTENANRIGDWLQLESFTTYGQNIYLNSHLVESIASRNKNAYISYVYDSYSKITQTSVVVTDSMLNKVIYTYDMQYETY